MKTFRNIAIILFISIIITFIFDFVLGGTSWKNLFLNILYGFIIGTPEVTPNNQLSLEYWLNPIPGNRSLEPENSVY